MSYNQDVLPRPGVGSNLTLIQKASVLIFMYQSFVTLFCLILAKAVVTYI